MLTDRKIKVLEAIINDFISFAQPVGSRTISKKYLIGISPATIRNEMADLEELGYLFQPHTSAGRIPSDLAYRLFVDSFTNGTKMGVKDLRTIRSVLYGRVIEPLEVAKRAVDILTKKTGNVAIVTLPSFGKGRLENLKIVKVTENMALMILVEKKGEFRTIEMNVNLSQDELDQISEYLLHLFKGKCIEDIDAKAVRHLDPDVFVSEAEYFIPSMKAAMQSIRGNTILRGGTAELIIENHVKPALAKNLFEILDDKEEIEHLITEVSEESEGELNVRIGTEFEDDRLEDFALLCKKYNLDSSSNGIVAIIGPKRMDYKMVGSLVNTIANSMTEVFTGIHL